MINFTKQDSLLVKGIAVLIMIYYHSVALSGRAAFSLFGNVLAKTGNICVALFAFITVYGTTKSLLIKEERGKFSVKEALCHSLSSLYRSYLPAFLYAIVLSFLFDRLHDVIWQAETSTWISSYGSGHKSLVYALINGAGFTHLLFGDFRYTLNQTWWYMSLAILLAVMTVMVFATRKKKWLWVPVIAVYAILAMKRPMYFQYLMMVPIGMFFATRKMFYKHSTIASLAILGIIVLWGYMRIYVSGPWNTIVDVIASYPIIVITCMLIQRLHLSKPLVYFGTHSANLFYLHSFVYLYWRPLGFVVDSLRVGYLIFPVTVALTLLFSAPLEHLKKLKKMNEKSKLLQK